jgi:hypothetical protein
MGSELDNVTRLRSDAAVRPLAPRTAAPDDKAMSWYQARIALLKVPLSTGVLIPPLEVEVGA